MPMKNRSRLLAFLVLSGITAHAAAAAAEPSSEDHTAHAAHGTPATQDSHAAPAAPDAAAPTNPPAKRWASDAALREGMGRVQAALKELRHHELGHMPLAAVREQAAQIEAAIRFLFANCRLAPDADAALHSILLPLLQSAKHLQSEPADRATVAALRAAVAPYPRQFDDPGWPATPDSAAAQ